MLCFVIVQLEEKSNHGPPTLSHLPIAIFVDALFVCVRLSFPFSLTYGSHGAVVTKALIFTLSLALLSITKWMLWLANPLTHMQYSFSVPLGSSLLPSLPLSSLSLAVRFMFFSFAVTFWLTVISLIGTKRTIRYCRSHGCCRDSPVRFFFVNVGASMGS